jgi:hypothetical protein
MTAPSSALRLVTQPRMPYDLGFRLVKRVALAAASEPRNKEPRSERGEK